MTGESTGQSARSLPWMFISAVLHLALLLVLGFVVAAPADRHESRPDQLKRISSEKLEQAGEKLRAINRNELEQNLDRLEQIERQMRELQRDQAERLAREMSKRPEAARERARELVRQIVDEQEKLLEMQSDVGPRLEAAGRAVVELASTEEDHARIARFGADGQGRAAVEHLSQVGREIDVANARINRIQQLQVQLAEEIAWMGSPTLADAQAAALATQEHAKRQHNHTRDRLAWLRRDLDMLDERVGAYLRVFATRQMRDHVRRYAHGSIENLMRHPEELDNRHAEAVLAHKHALDAQRVVLSALDDAPVRPELRPEEFLADATSVAGDGSETASNESTRADSPSATDDAGRQRPTLSTLYEQMVRTEQALGRMHRDIRIGAVVRNSGASPTVAERQVHADAPSRPVLDRDSLDGPIGSGAAYERYQQQLATVVATSRSMVHSAQAILASAQSVVHSDAARVSEATPSGLDDSADAAAPATDAAVGHLNFASQLPGGGRDPGDGQPSAIDLETWRQRVMAQVQSARYIGGDPDPDTPWTFVNGWYMIGPFTTGNSADLHRSYTPESLIDLDATYIGPDGRRLIWTFRKEAEPGTMYFPVQNVNSVYYAFTHIKSDRQIQVTLAVTSDDASRLWINGEPIEPVGWQETNDRHPWLFSFGHDIARYACHLHYRGYRQAQLKEGINTLLIRVENGPGGTGFAVYVRPR